MHGCINTKNCDIVDIKDVRYVGVPHTHAQTPSTRAHTHTHALTHPHGRTANVNKTTTFT